MKRYTRIHSNTRCIIPITAVTYIMLSMAVLTIISFISIEIVKLFCARDLLSEDIDNSERNKFKFGETSNFENLTLDIDNTTNEGVTKLTTVNFYNYELADIKQVLSLCVGNLFLLVLVTSVPENFEHRDVIRKTWANLRTSHSWLEGLKTQTIFLVGQSHSRFINTLLKSENGISGDILLGNYLDTQRNDTLKVVTGLTWAASDCPSLYILKTSDDSFVNLDFLLRFLWKSNTVRTNLYAGKVRWSSSEFQNQNRMWDVSLTKTRFVPYIASPGYVMSQDVLQKFVQYVEPMVRRNEEIKLRTNEDVFVGSVLNIAGIRPTYSTRFVSHYRGVQVCDFKYLFVIHPVTSGGQVEFQDMASKAYRMCHKVDAATDWIAA